tara:strand:- start:65 stop:556 length:492 start_codon:yes stop_codon:yes gene_type:complete
MNKSVVLGVNGVLSIFAVIILVKVYHYLVDMESCPCFQSSQHKDMKVDLEYMKFYQVLEIVTTLIFFGSLFIYNLKHKSMKGGGRIGMRFISIISFMILLFIFGYMTYNVLGFYMSIKDSCKCANKWQKYFIYLQGIGASISTLRLLYGFLLVVMIILAGIKL